MTKKKIVIYLTTIGMLLILTIGVYVTSFLTQSEPAFFIFDGQRALSDVQTQVSFGSRTVGTLGHEQTVSWMRTELESEGWDVQIQESEMLGHPIQNVIASRIDEPPQIILGTHYDTRIYADNDPDPMNQNQPVPGANDGASGVAVLLELARTLPKDSLPVWLVFFDAEDNGRIQGWDWSLGSKAFVNALDFSPEAVVVVDMIGDANLNIYMEGYSDPELSNEIWGVASELGFNQFIPKVKHNIIDDHTPFLQAGIPAIDIIDIEYPHWHTTADTVDKVSAESLQAVGETLLTWISRKGK